MKKSIHALCITFMVLCSGCGNDPFHRLAYSAVQGIGRDQCMEQTTTNKLNDCLKADSYDEYQSKLQELNSSK
jgi:hypothetical protein